MTKLRGVDVYDIGGQQIDPSTEQGQDAANVLLTILANYVSTLGQVKGAVDVHIKDVHYVGFSVHAVRVPDSPVNVSFGPAGASKGDSVITMTTGGGSALTVDSYYCIEEGTTRETDLVTILAISGDDVTIDRPLENDYTAAASIMLRERNIAESSGTVANPVIFRVQPPAAEVWHIHTITMHSEGSNAPENRYFNCNSTALTNGFVIRQNNSETINESIFRSNGDVKKYFGAKNVEFIERGTVLDDWAVNGSWHYAERTHSIIHLDGSIGDCIDFINQDANDLANTQVFEIMAQGHKEIID